MKVKIIRIKIVKRILLIFLGSILLIVSIGYKFGYFNELLNTYQEKKIVNDLKNSDGFVDEESTASVINGEGVDVETTASIDDEVGSKQQNNNQITVPESVVNDGSLVSIVQSSKQFYQDITDDEIREMVRQAVTLAGGFKGFIKDHQVVVLKPNLVQMHVDSTGDLFTREFNGITTDWRVTKAVVELVREYNPNGKVYIMEGSAGDKTRDVMNYLNYTHDYIPGVDEFIAIEEDSGEWQELDSPALIKYSLPNGLLHKEYYLNRKYYEADILISIPTLKTNSGAVVTGGIKNVSIGATPANIYGLSQNSLSRTKMVSHRIVDGELDKWIHDYYLCRPVQFVVIDGLVGFQNGPVPMGRKNISSDKMNMRLVMAGRDAVAVDAVEALVTGWDPLSIAYLGYLNKSFMGNLDTARITVAGKNVDEVRKDFSNRFPKLGGLRITDREGPEFSINENTVNEDKVDIKLEADEETIKVEIYIDGRLHAAIPAPLHKDISIDITDLPKGKHLVSVYCFDRYLNRSFKTLEISR
ncbi:MAG: DUF362 domain-containing protein [Bacillota bacterium]